MDSPIYLDHAATSFPKPPVVLETMQRWYQELGVSAQRGHGQTCRTVAKEVLQVRDRLAQLTGMPAERITFNSGATEGLNLFLRGFLTAGDTVLTSTLEHSSVVRPLLQLQKELDLRLLVHPAAELATALQQERPRLLVFTHASNVTGQVLPAAELCALAREGQCISLLDASQTAGLLPLDLGADALVASAHKSLLAPPGLGILAVQPWIDLQPQKQGGTGSSLALAEHPKQWPTTMEAGTPNTPAILALGAAMDWLQQQDPAQLLARELSCLDELQELLTGQARIFHPANDQARIPVLSLSFAHLDPMEAAMLLDERGIHVRSGFHCAPWIHKELGTEAAGTLRISAGPFTTADDVRQVPKALGL